MFNLVDKYSKTVRKIIRQKTGGANPDLEQEIFFRLWQKQEQYVDQGKERAWVCIVATNICRDYFKSKFVVHACKHVDMPRDVTDERQNPEIKFTQNERQKIILAAVNSLPRKMRQVIVLHEFEYMPLDDIAKRLNVPVGTVKSRLFSARKILAQRLCFLKPNEL
ncbi:MAG: sigma-70 family RNA polymerase sigma factor [Alphaproteobacteria bacterium]|nr:sigma-70 family RNA polymerase sigma factor [Alphaproteobacteria bacterium]MDE6571468.1 sigma-70 family RNA polymerase sigma factor [Alphaproteobacteria bacterium]